jgi:hypothetical protein
VEYIQVAPSEAKVPSEELALFEQVQSLQLTFVLAVVLEELLFPFLPRVPADFLVLLARAVLQVEEEGGPCFSDCRPR